MAGELTLALARACQEFSESIAISGPEFSLTYATLAEEAGRISSALLKAGAQPNEPVHIQVSNDPLDLAALLGVWGAGCVAVPIHRTTPPGVATRVFEKTRARLVLDVRAPNSALVSVIAAEPPSFRTMLEDAAFVIFTSGSTGAPKGVVVSHQAFHAKVEQIDSKLNFRASDRTLLVLNITFSFGLWVSILTLLRGGTLVMKEKFDPVSFVQSLGNDRVTNIGMVPTMMRVLFSNSILMSELDVALKKGAPRQIFIGGESLGSSLASEIRRRFADSRLVDIYGLTETSTCDFFSFPEDYDCYPGCIGRPSPNVSFRIVDSNGNVAEPGQVGELQIRSPYLMNGYLDEPELTAGVFSEGWFKTGDLAMTVEPSVVKLMGRSKEIISRGGNKVTPIEIEQSLCTHPDVAAAMAVGVGDSLLGERIHVLLVPRTGSVLDIPVLKRHLESRLEKFKHPDTYYVAEALPLGRTGKADRGQFKSMIECSAIVPITSCI